jgi:hypothetical protein
MIVGPRLCLLCADHELVNAAEQRQHQDSSRYPGISAARNVAPSTRSHSQKKGANQNDFLLGWSCHCRLVLRSLHGSGAGIAIGVDQPRGAEGSVLLSMAGSQTTSRLTVLALRVRHARPYSGPYTGGSSTVAPAMRLASRGAWKTKEKTLPSWLG